MSTRLEGHIAANIPQQQCERSPPLQVSEDVCKMRPSSPEPGHPSASLVFASFHVRESFVKRKVNVGVTQRR